METRTQTSRVNPLNQFDTLSWPDNTSGDEFELQPPPAGQRHTREDAEFLNRLVVPQ